MSVSPQARRGGFGKKLVRVVEEFAAEQGFREVILTTGSIMVPAMKLYTAAGWEHHRKGFVPAELRAQMRLAGESELYEAAFRKPITSNMGRWMWQQHPAKL
jgi:ribosomal protein S18 acetylase RimI-like enzyme